MASYQDSQNVFLPHKTPFVDLNLYSEALQYKQQQYNQGISRIQSSYDSVAGLDVARDVDKQYLQNKLAETTTKLNQMAGGDFSNQSLVAQASSLAPQIAKDPNVQSAVLSTQGIRSLMTSSKSLKAKNPELYPIQQEWRDSQEVGKYLANQDLGATYNGPREASRYKNYRPDLESQVKAIVPEVKMEINADGKFQWKKEKYSTVTNDRIESVISSYFATNSDAQNSLETDALFTYRAHTPEALASQAKKSYAYSISKLEEINTRYKEQARNNSKDADFVADRTAAIIANQNTIQRMKETILGTTDKNGKFTEGTYIEALKDPAQFDMVKKTVFGDNLKAMYSTTFQKDEVDRSIEANINAKEGMDNYWKGISASQAHMNTVLEATKAGFKYDENGNLVSLTPNDPAYATYYHNSKKKSDGSVDEGHTYGQSFVAATDATGKLSESYIQKNLDDLDAALTVQKNEYFLHWRGANGTQTMADFDNYTKDQAKLFLSGDPTVSNEYLRYRAVTDPYQRDMNTNAELLTKAQEEGSKQFPIVSKNIVIPIKDEKGNVKVNFTVDPSKHGAFISTLRSVYGDAEAKAYETKDSHNQPIEFISPTLRRRVTNELLDSKYKSSPFYKQLRELNNSGGGAIGNDGLSTAYNIIVVPHDALMSDRKKVEDKYLMDNSKDFAPWENPYNEKDADLGDIKRTITSLIGINQGLGYNKDKYAESGIPKDIEPLGVQVNAANQAVYHFKWGENKEDFITDTSPGSGLKVPGYDPYADVKRTIKLVKHTPLIGDGVLHTFDGKIRYQIKEAYGGGYSLSLIQNGMLVGEKQDQDVTSLILSMEKFSNQTGATGKPLTREEAYYLFTNGEEAYKQKYAKQ